MSNMSMTTGSMFDNLSSTEIWGHVEDRKRKFASSISDDTIIKRFKSCDCEDCIESHSSDLSYDQNSSIYFAENNCFGNTIEDADFFMPVCFSTPTKKDNTCDRFSWAHDVSSDFSIASSLRKEKPSLDKNGTNSSSSCTYDRLSWIHGISLDSSIASSPQKEKPSLDENGTNSSSSCKYDRFSWIHGISLDSSIASSLRKEKESLDENGTNSSSSCKYDRFSWIHDISLDSSVEITKKKNKTIDSCSWVPAINLSIESSLEVSIQECGQSRSRKEIDGLCSSSFGSSSSTCSSSTTCSSSSDNSSSSV